MADSESVLELRTEDGLAKYPETIEDELLAAVDRACDEGTVTWVKRNGAQVAAIVPAGALGVVYE
jgi:hypothetical protein